VSLFAAAMQRWAARGGVQPAIEDDAGQEVRWAQMPHAIACEQLRLSRQLRGTRRPVAMQASQGVAACIAELALLELGVPVLSLPAFFTAAQVAHALAHSGAQAILHDGGTTLRMEPVDGAAPPPVLPSGTARISYTSGSTGAPQGICLSASHLLAVADAVATNLGGLHSGRHLAVLPPGLLLENVAGCYATLLAGGTYVAWSQQRIGLGNPFRPDFAALAAAIDAARARSIILVPEYLAGLVASLERSGQRLASLSLVAVGGARVAPVLLERAAAVGLPVRQGYGLTECGSVVALEDGAAASRGSVGHGLGAHRIWLADDGEILVDGPLYLGTVGAPRPDGPLATGDLGRLDADGRLWIEGRKSNLIVTSFGRNVSPEWPESLLAQQPEIAQCMVYGDGLPLPEVLVVPRGPTAAVDAAIARVNAQLPDYARLARWRAVAPFTVADGLLTGNGRLRRAAIAHLYLSREAADAVL
jgi:long-subunit acyl-CoA synthetase (AMP-forming)